MPTSQALVGQLSTEPGGAAAMDDFQGGSVASLVIQLDKSILSGSGDIVAVWASTHTR